MYILHIYTFRQALIAAKGRNDRRAPIHFHTQLAHPKSIVDLTTEQKKKNKTNEPLNMKDTKTISFRLLSKLNALPKRPHRRPPTVLGAERVAPKDAAPRGASTSELAQNVSNSTGLGTVLAAAANFRF